MSDETTFFRHKAGNGLHWSNSQYFLGNKKIWLFMYWGIFIRPILLPKSMRRSICNKAAHLWLDCQVKLLKQMIFYPNFRISIYLLVTDLVIIIGKVFQACLLSHSSTEKLLGNNYILYGTNWKINTTDLLVPLCMRKTYDIVSLNYLVKWPWKCSCFFIRKCWN